MEVLRKKYGNFNNVYHISINTALIIIFFTHHITAPFSPYEQNMLTFIPAYSLIADHIHDCDTDNAQHDMYHKTIANAYAEASTNPLLKSYPLLRTTLSYIPLGHLPTPIHYCVTFNNAYPSFSLFIKNDGLTGTLNTHGKRNFGGNKLRKLQYLLADAIAHGHDTVLTFGCVGSNHAVQTAVCAEQLNLQCICMLKPQPNSHIVQRNLILHHLYNSIIMHSDTNVERALATIELCKTYKNNNSKLPYIIPTGGSNARGAIGYVEAAFELKEQIDAGLIPQPDHIYVTLGSGGTAAGLLLGCRAANITTQWHLVLDEPTDEEHAWKKLEKLFYETNQLLHSLDATFPLCTLDKNNCCIENAYTGTAYGLFTPECIHAIHTIKNNENITLDGVYTGKCMSALLADAQKGILDNSTVLFWNTFCAEDMTHVTHSIDYHLLPKEFHIYFESEVQSL